MSKTDNWIQQTAGYARHRYGSLSYVGGDSAVSRKQIKNSGQEEKECIRSNEKLVCEIFCDNNGAFRYDLEQKYPYIPFQDEERLGITSLTLPSNAKWCSKYCSTGSTPEQEDARLLYWKSKDTNPDKKCFSEDDSVVQIYKLVNKKLDKETLELKTASKMCQADKNNAVPYNWCGECMKPSKDRFDKFVWKPNVVESRLICNNCYDQDPTTNKFWSECSTINEELAQH